MKYIKGERAEGYRDPEKIPRLPRFSPTKGWLPSPPTAITDLSTRPTAVSRPKVLPASLRTATVGLDKTPPFDLEVSVAW